MRKPMMAGNWKMNKTIAEARQLAQAIHDNVVDYDNVERVVCPPFVCLPAVRDVLSDSPVALGAQNVHWAENGAYTGEISAPMLDGVVQYVIIGHSERRQYYNETDESVNRKIQIALRHTLTPIVCVGESLEVNEGGRTHEFVSAQVKAALTDLSADHVQRLVIAYEPIWAIGTGKAATAADANRVCGESIRAVLAELYWSEVAENTRILYGGSTNPDNIETIMQQENVDGALIGGASLKADSYGEMVRMTSGLYEKS